MIDILNYGMGNIGSIQNMLKKVGVSNRVISKAEEVDSSQALIIPGVGHFDNAMKKLDEQELRNSLDSAAIQRRIPILGICLGMQIMTNSSEEGVFPGLGWVKAKAIRINGGDEGLSVPHMGWNLLNLRDKSHPYFNNDGFSEHRFYFVHSYAVHCDDQSNILTTTNYAGNFVSSFLCENLTGVQFHPEKSHKFGESFFRRYAESIQLKNV